MKYIKYFEGTEYDYRNNIYDYLLPLTDSGFEVRSSFIYPEIIVYIFKKYSDKHISFSSFEIKDDIEFMINNINKDYTLSNIRISKFNGDIEKDKSDSVSGLNNYNITLNELFNIDIKLIRISFEFEKVKHKSFIRRVFSK